MTDAAASFTSANPVKASAEAIARLSGVPRIFRFGLMMLLNFKSGRLTVVLPDGREVVYGAERTGPAATMRIHDFAMVKKVVSGGDVGFAESYMQGLWSTPDLAKVLEVFSANLDRIKALTVGGPVTRFFHGLYHRLRANTKKQARKNIEAHYDLGNDFYELWLDPTMTYSSARFTDQTATLEAAQREKYAALARSIDLQPGQSVLEIGCGWGGFAEYAAGEIGAQVTCLTLSPSQRDYAIARMERQGLGGKVEIKLQDYRDEIGIYDRVASIEMFEAVGEQYWPSFFSKVEQVLKPDGRAGLQIITIEDRLFEEYRRRTDFIQRYIFPGGALPSPEKLREQVSAAGLAMTEADMFALDYARTLGEWRRTFLSRWNKIEPMGFDERFKRMWEFYLAYCEAGFRTGRIDVGQFTLAKG